jgi:hypothetical protein
MTTYNITSTQQLFDISKGLTNFQSAFRVQSSTNEPFYGVVVNQEMLDTGAEIQFQHAKDGVLAGDMTQSDNIRRNWFLLLKSDTPQAVVVSIDTQQVTPAVQTPAPAPVARPQQVIQVPPAAVAAAAPAAVGGFKLFSIKTLLILALIGIGAFFLYSYLKKRPRATTLPPVTVADVPAAPVEPQLSVAETDKLASGVLGPTLMDQIKHLPKL